MTARRTSYLVTVTANTGLMLLNLVAMVSAAWRGAGLGSVDFSAAFACLGAITLWFVIAAESWFTVKHATLTSLLEEQQADTRMKQVMVEKIESGQLEMSVSAIRQPRAH
jgi:hypothetical protein